MGAQAQEKVLCKWVGAGAPGASVSKPFFCKLNFSRCCACFFECSIPSNVLLGLLSWVLVGARGVRNFGTSLRASPGVGSLLPSPPRPPH
jgi:hypothetical protein